MDNAVKIIEYEAYEHTFLCYDKERNGDYYRYNRILINQNEQTHEFLHWLRRRLLQELPENMGSVFRGLRFPKINLRFLMISPIEYISTYCI